MTMTNDKIQYYAVYDTQLQGFCDCYSHDKDYILNEWRDYWTNIASCEEMEDIISQHPEFDMDQIEAELTKALYDITNEEFYNKCGFEVVEVDSNMIRDIDCYFSQDYADSRYIIELPATE